MSTQIEFNRNYTDHSTEQGFQFEFHCDRCGNGVRSTFRPSATGAVNNVLGTASSLLGGIFSSAASVGDRIHSATWEKAHDAAFVQAANEVKGKFVQCPRCSSWVCRQSCWNERKGLCKNCAPDLGVEMSAAQASKSVEEVWAHAAMAEEDKKLDTAQWRETIRASCPECGAPMATNAKFCPSCGAKLKASTHCSECGAKLLPGAKFCAECGTKVA